MSKSASPGRVDHPGDKFLKSIVTLSEVASQPAPSNRMLLADLLPTGLIGMTGLPTSGKSNLAILQSLGVCTGMQVGQMFPLQTGSALYCTTETSRHEICSRASAYLQNPRILPRNFFVSAETGENFEDWLNGFESLLDHLRDVRIAVLDPVVSFLRELTHANYAKQYLIFGRLRQLAKERGMALLLVSHCTKKAGNRISSSYGSVALPACADAMQTIDREQGTLTVSGNTFGDQVYEISAFDGYPPYLSNRLNPGLQNIRLTPEQKEVFMEIGRSPLPYARAKELERVFSGVRSGAAVRQLLGHLKEKGLILPFRRGIYQLSTPGKQYFEELVNRQRAQERIRDHWGRLASFVAPDLDEELTPTTPELFFVEPDYDPLTRNFNDDLQDAFLESLGKGSEDRPSPDQETTKLAEPEPFAENPVVVDEPVIEPELEAGSPAEPKVDIPTEADAPEGSSPGDHEEGKEEAGPGGPLLPSEDTDAADAERESNGTEQGEPKDLLEGRLHEGYDKVSSTGPVTAVTGTPGLAAPVPHTQDGQASIEAPDREAFEAARDAIGFRTLKLDTEYGNDTREALKQEYKEKFIDCAVRGKSAFLATESEPYSFESMVMDGELGKSLKRYSESQCLEALDLFVELAERGLLIHLKDWNRKFELRPVKEGHASIERPDGVATTLAERFSSSPPEILPRLESLEPVLCALMSEKGWEAVSNFIQGRYLSRWESGVLFDAFFNKRRPSTASLGTGLKKPERFHRLLIACQEPENSGLVCLRHDPSQFVFPLRRRQIRESLGLPTWPGDRTAR